MVRIPGIYEKKEVKLINIDKQALKKEGWEVCGMKCKDGETIVVFERPRDISPDVRT
jgi:hypothetical protein